MNSSVVNAILTASIAAAQAVAAAVPAWAPYAEAVAGVLTAVLGFFAHQAHSNVRMLRAAAAVQEEKKAA